MRHIPPFALSLTHAQAYEDDPRFPHYFCQVYPTDGEPFLTSGIDRVDSSARTKALAEAIERVCLGTPTTLSPVRSYRASPTTFVDPSLWLSKRASGASARQVRNSPFRWVCGQDLVSGSRVWLPAQQVYVPYPHDDEIVLRRPISTGAAFGRSVRDATMRGLLECIERDAFMIAYLKRWPLPNVISPQVAALTAQFGMSRSALHVFRIPNDFGVLVIMAVIVDSTGRGPAVSVGLKAALRPMRAVLGAVLEAHHVRFCSRKLFADGAAPVVTKADQVIDVTTRAAFWYRRGSERRLTFLNRAPSRRTAQRRPPNGIVSLVKRLAAQGCHVYRVVLANEPSVGAVVRVMIPELQPLQRVEERGQFISGHLQKFGASRLNRLPNPFE